MYVPTLRRLSMTCVVRLNGPDTCDKGEFKRAGIAHHGRSNMPHGVRGPAVAWQRAAVPGAGALPPGVFAAICWRRR